MAKAVVKSKQELRQSFLTQYLLCAKRAFLDMEVPETEALNEDHQKFGNIVHEIGQMIGIGQAPKEPWAHFLKLSKKHKLTNASYFDLETRRLFEEWFERVVVDCHDEEIGGVEEEFHTVLNGVPVKGTMDRWGWKVGHVHLAIVDGKKVKTGDTPRRLRLTDYKTNRVPYSRQEVEESVQFHIYAAELFRRFPAIDEIDIVYDLVRFGQFTHTIKRADMDEFLDWLATMWDVIKSDTERRATVNKYCSWCKHKMDCTAYIQMMKDANKGGVPMTIVNPQNESEWRALFDTLRQIKATIKALTSRADEVEQLFRAHLADIGPVKIGDREEIYLMTNPRYNYDATQVSKALRDLDKAHLLPEVVSVSNSNLERLAERHPDVAAAIEPLKQMEFVKPTLKSRKVKV